MRRLAFGLIIAALSAGEARDCPPACSCSEPKSQTDSFGVVADCSNRDLKQVPEGLSVFTIELDLSNNNISFLPPKVLTKYHFLQKN